MPGWWLRLVSLVVPRHRRAEWRAEWRAELAGSPHRHPRLSLATGALRHAVWMRWLEWTFASSDLRYAARLARRQPGFAAVVIATLALGIGAATAMFSVVNGVLLKPLPYPEPDRLVYGVGAFRHNASASVSPPDFLDYRARNVSFDAFGAMLRSPREVTAIGADGPERLDAAVITSGVVPALGVPLVMGRDFTRDEERRAGRPAVIVSERYWRQRMGGRPDALGHAVTIEGVPHAIVGVAPATLRVPYESGIANAGVIDLLLPFPFDDEQAQVRGYHYLRVVGRLKAGTSLEAAQAQVDVVARDLEVTYPQTNETWRLRLLRLEDHLVGGVRATLLIMMGAVLLVLIIACANVAGLLLARGASRRGEVAVRRALGAPRARVVRQFLMEGALFALAGAAAGLLIATLAVAAVRRAAPGDLPRLDDVALDPSVVVFAVTAGVLTTLLFALLPAWQIAGRRDVATLRDMGRTTGSRETSRLRAMLVTGQVALSTLLLIAAGLLARSFVALTSVDTGFATGNVLVARVSLPDERYPADSDAERFFGALGDSLAALPGVSAAAFSTTPPLMGGNDIMTYPEGQPPLRQADRRFPQVSWVRGPYFAAADIPILRGRPFDDARDAPGAPAVAVISQGMADRFFPGVDPIGRRLVAAFEEPVVAVVVGIAGDARIFGQLYDAPDMLYLSARQFPGTGMTAIVQATVPTIDLVPSVRAAVAQLDPALALGRVDTLGALLDASVARPRFRTLLIAAFACVALALTLVGLYGTLAYAVGQRAREIGIRMALGARPRGVVTLVAAHGARLVGAGLLLGMIGAFAAARLIEGMLFAVGARDALVFGLVPLLVAMAAASAVVVPARRAARTDPVTVLRSGA